MTPRERRVPGQQIYDLAAEIAIAAAALMYAADDPRRWERFVQFAGKLGGPGAVETGVLTPAYAEAAAMRLASLAKGAMDTVVREAN